MASLLSTDVVVSILVSVYRYQHRVDTCSTLYMYCILHTHYYNKLHNYYDKHKGSLFTQLHGHIVP